MRTIVEYNTAENDPGGINSSSGCVRSSTPGSPSSFYGQAVNWAGTLRMTATELAMIHVPPPLIFPRTHHLRRASYTALGECHASFLFIFLRVTATRTSTHRPQYMSSGIIQHRQLTDAFPIYAMPIRLLFLLPFRVMRSARSGFTRICPSAIIMDRALARQVLQEFCGACSMRGVCPSKDVFLTQARRE